MRVKITEIDKASNHYFFKDKLIGTIGVVSSSHAKAGGWHYLALEECEFPDGSKEYSNYFNRMIIFNGAKYEEVS